MLKVLGKKKALEVAVQGVGKSPFSVHSKESRDGI